MSDTRTHPAYPTFTGLADAYGIPAALHAVAARFGELDHPTRVGLTVAYCLPRARELGETNGRTVGALVIDQHTPAVTVARCARLYQPHPQVWRAEFGTPHEPLSGHWAAISTPSLLLAELGARDVLRAEQRPGHDADPADRDQLDREVRAAGELAATYELAWQTARDEAIMQSAIRRARARGRVKPWHETIPAGDLKPGDLIHVGGTNYVLTAHVDTTGTHVAVTIFNGDQPHPDGPTLSYAVTDAVELSVFYR